MKIKRYSPIIIIIISILFLFAIKDKFIINPSKSLTRGIYKKIEIDSIKTGDIVCFKIPKNIELLAKKRKYILEDANTLMKIVAATNRDKVSVVDDELYINNISWGKISYYDSYNRQLYPVQDLQPLQDDEYLLLSKVKKSFDGRYIGLIKRKDILFKTELLLKF